MFIGNHFVQCLARGCIFLPHRDSCACVLKHQKLAAFRSLFSGTVGKEEKDKPCQKRHICSLSDSMPPSWARLQANWQLLHITALAQAVKLGPDHSAIS